MWQAGQPEDWLDFSANLRPEGPPDWVNAAMLDAAKRARYYPDTAMRGATAGLAAYAGVPENCILPTAGGIQAIDAALCEGTGRVILNPPTFSAYAQCAALHERSVSNDLSSARTGDTAVLCNPNNPTGEAMARENVLALFERLHAMDAALLVDEAFSDYCPDISVRDIAARQKGLMVVGSLTKILCVPGVRLGYLIAEPGTLARIRGRCLPWQLNAFAAAIAQALPAHLASLREERDANAARRAALFDGLHALGASPMPSRANFLLTDFKRPMDQIAARLKDHERILVRACASFGLDARWLRLAVRTQEENAHLLSALKKQMEA